MSITEQIRRNEERIKELRIAWRTATPAWKKFIEANAKILKEKTADLQKQSEREK